MHLATIRTGDTTVAVTRTERDGAQVLVALPHADLGELLSDPDGLSTAAAVTRGEQPGGAVYNEGAVEFAAPVPAPSKVVCVAHNYGQHLTKLGLPVPQHPRLSTKFASSLIGPHDPITLPADARTLDCAAELAIVIGASVRHADDAAAAAAIAGFTVINDVVDRDLEFEAHEWGTGNVWDGCTPVGPYLVTPDALPGAEFPQVKLSTTIDGTVVQEASTADLHFDPIHLVRRISRFLTLAPGEIIATGSPSSPGADHGLHLTPGQEIVTEIEGIGACRNRVAAMAVD
ncbi:MAG: fumarylacetoacetate hydrolase family protein [Gordonia sp. (in: high G+C Gram-positive bacteria)]|uniref:fumarylacetoacetate hydrolase family protein n=1 Tax=Gordonia sp. (in: high G+C Gram-positive bacteria) TaxID=84139 RepID=UPI003C779514